MLFSKKKGKINLHIFKWNNQDKKTILNIERWNKDYKKWEQEEGGYLETDLFSSPFSKFDDNSVLMFFNNCNIDYFNYFKKNKSVFRTPYRRFKILVNAITHSGRKDSSRKLIMGMYKVFLNDHFFIKPFSSTNPSKNKLVGKNQSKKNKFNMMKKLERLKLTLSYYTTEKFMNLFFGLNVFFKISYHRTGKLIRKFSRGKADKFRTKYNYIPFFKRDRFKAKQFKKNLNYIWGNNYNERIKILTWMYRWKFQKTTIFYERKKAMKAIYSEHKNTVLLRSY